MPATARAASGPLAGSLVAPISLDRLVKFTEACIAQKVGYGFGSKDAHPGSGQVTFTEIDCSGFVRTALMWAAGGAFHDLPDGSYTQGEYFAAAGFKPTQAASGGLCDGVLRVFVHHPDHKDETGHVWLTFGRPGSSNPHTLESHGGLGVSMRDWNAPVHGGLYTLDQYASVGFCLAAF